MNEFRIEVTIAASVDEVWRALREPAQIRHWHGWEFEEKGGLDAEIDQIYLQDAAESAESHTLTVQGGDTFTLHDAGDGRTLVRLVRAPRGTNPDWDAYYDDINEGWTTFLHQLRFALEHHRGLPRRTVFLDGETAGSPFETLDLPRNAEPGSAYTASVAGETLTGQVWFRSANQTGFTVDSWDDGLLIVGVAPQGGVMAVLTTYRHNEEDTYRAFRTRWTQWWRELFPAKPAPVDA